MVKNDLKSNAKSVQNYLTCTIDIHIKPNFGALIATMPFISGNIAKTALFINVIMTDVLLISKILMPLTPLRKLYVELNLPSLNCATNFVSTTLPMNNSSILPLTHRS
jgi:hypothetical protein